jgi:hypothetical protein
MGPFGGWLKRRQAKEHAKLIGQCRAKATALIGFLEEAHAVTPNLELARTIEQLQVFDGNLARLNVGFVMEGKLRPQDAEYLIGQLRALTAAVAGFVQVNKSLKRS